MSIYTGNNGRMYIARRQSSGLFGTRTLNILAGKRVNANETLTAITAEGSGRGAAFQAGNRVLENDSSRACNFTITAGGNGYEATTRIYLARFTRGAWEQVTGTFTVGTVLTRGVDNERELLTDEYRVAKIRDWTYNSNSEVIETTALGDTTKTFSPSITSGDGSATLLFYEDDINDNVPTRSKDIYELVDILFPRDVAPRVIMSLVVDSGAYTLNAQELFKTNFIFNAYITNASVSVSYGDVVAVSTSFTVDGPLIDVPNKPGVVRL
jgi:hypothetical protein